MGGLAAVSVWLSALPRGWALALGLGALFAAVGRALREWRLPAAVVAWAGEDEVRLLQGGREHRLAHLNVRWRGPLATLVARDEAGKLRRLSWWPDTLPAPARRRLRLAAEPSPRRTRAATASSTATTLGT
jgi:toxin CptA